MNSIKNVTCDGGRDVPVPPNSSSGVQAKHPSSALMQLLNTPAIQETVVRRVHGGFGDVYTVSEDANILTVELDFLSCEDATAMATIIAEEIVSTRKSADEQMSYDVVPGQGRCVISYEIVPGKDGRLTNICVAVSNNSQLGRRAMRLVMSTFLLRCFRRNRTSAFYLKQVGDPYWNVTHEE
jgi:hypothetical protein